MSRVTLIHWNAAEAKERAHRLRAAGHAAQVLSAGSGEALRQFRENPPAAFVIDLSRLPSQGRAVGVFLRQQKATRHVPLIFVGGQAEKVESVRKLLPDAVYTEWSRIRSDLSRAIKRLPAKPVVPGTMEGYSGSPLVKKLGIRSGSVVLAGAPADFERSLVGLPEGVRLTRRLCAPASTILLFVRSQAELSKRFPAAARALADGGKLWLIWPKKTSRLAGDLGEAEVRAFGLAHKFVDYKICAVDENWSGLLFARRKASRPAAHI
jgi:CheY-like chemotaxis protein